MSLLQSETMLLKNMPSGWWPTSTNMSLSLYNGFTSDYATLYEVQPNVRTCVDFLARNIAQLGLHVYRRDEKKGRIRLRDHPLALLLARPLPNQMKSTSYRMIESMMGDVGVFGRSYLKKEIDDNGKLIGLVRIPAGMVTNKGVLMPTEYMVKLGGKTLTYQPDEIVHFRMYHPSNNVGSISPLETLRRILAEEHAAGSYRENFWQNAARMSGVITRPKDAGALSGPALERLRSQWQELYSGEKNSGKTAILEEGMEFKQVSFNPKDSEYLEGRKLTREECARAYHIPPPLVGILDHATYSNIQEQHKGLYNDVVGPYMAMIEEDLLMQLKDNYDNMDGVYLEFNIQEKLQGDFEAQIKSLQSATGAPWLLRNEARDIMNLERVDGFDEPVEPLNVLIGGQASPTDSAPKSGAPTPTSHDVGAAVDASTASHLEGRKAAQLESFDMEEPGLREIYDDKWRTLLVRTFERQRNAVLPAVKSQDIHTVWDLDRWNAELTADFRPLSLMTATAWAQVLGKKLGIIITDDMLQGFTDENARIAAEYLNESTQEQIESALAGEDPKASIQHVFEVLLAATVGRFAIGRVTSLSNYGAYQAAVRGGITTKTWVVNSTNPRDSHAAMNGETVGVHERFSNSMRWPGDYEGSAAETVNCECSLRYNREDVS